jgi:hypothetical protein
MASCDSLHELFLNLLHEKETFQKHMAVLSLYGIDFYENAMVRGVLAMTQPDLGDSCSQ